MIKLKPLLEGRLLSINKIDSTVKKELASAAQKEYDAWEQDENGYNEELGTGGICHLIADELINVLNKHGIWDVTTVSSSYEQHVYLVGKFKEGVYLIDIHWSVYEQGGGFSWKKLPDIVFDESDITIRGLDSNPRNFSQYVDEF